MMMMMMMMMKPIESDSSRLLSSSLKTLWLFLSVLERTILPRSLFLFLSLLKTKKGMANFGSVKRYLVLGLVVFRLLYETTAFN